MVRSKVAASFCEAGADILFEGGISTNGTLIDLAVTGRIRTNGANVALT